MSRRLTILLAGLVLLGVAVAWLGLGGARTTPTVEPTPGTPADPRARAPLAGELVEASPSAVSRREPVVDEASVSELEAAAPGSERSARLVVLVVAEGTRAPLAGVRLTLMPPTGGSAQHVEDTHGSLERSPLTAEEGRVEFELPPGLELSLRGWGVSAFAGSAQLAIDPMTPGEERTVVLALPTGLDLVYHGRVLAAADRRPVADARVEVVRDDFVTGTVTGPDGSFELELPSWSKVDIQILAPGYASVLLEPGQGHERPETARVVLLARTASLRAQVLDASGAPVPDVLVRLSTHAYHLGIAHHGGVYVPRQPDPSWQVRTDALGTCELDELPPDVPLAVALLAEGLPPRADLPPLALTAGEAREVTWRLGTGCRIEGRVVDERGAPVAEQRLWLVRAWMERPTYFEPHDSPVRRARSDAEGRFRMDDVAPGKWWLGPAAEARDASEDPVAPAAQLVEIATEELEAEVLVRIHRGLHLRGTVLGPDGAPASRAYVQGIGVEAGWGPQANTDEQGAFALGPLVPGR
ncbi:MAG TPA: carboxypeptidase-like regulatory domain-containing protein, partial [Planctomycetota bacterium]